MLKNGKWLVWLQLAVVLAIVVGALAATATGDDPVPQDPQCMWNYKLHGDVDGTSYSIYTTFEDLPCGGVTFTLSWVEYSGEEIIFSVHNLQMGVFPPDKWNGQASAGVDRIEVYCIAGTCSNCGSLCPSPSRHITLYIIADGKRDKVIDPDEALPHYRKHKGDKPR